MKIAAIQLSVFAAWLLSTYCIQAQEVSKSSKEELLDRKLRLGAVLIERLDPKESTEFMPKLEALRTMLDEGKALEMESDVDDFISTISIRYRNRTENTANKEQLEQVRYTARMQEVISYKESLDQMIKEQTEDSSDVFNEFSFSVRVDRAKTLANEGRHQAAYLVLEGAYNQLMVAIKGFRDNKTLEYKLDFDSIQDEFEYEKRRYESQKLLIELTMQEKELSPTVTEKLQQGLANAAQIHLEASSLAAQELFSESLEVEEQANVQLTSLLRLVGYFF